MKTLNKYPIYFLYTLIYDNKIEAFKKYINKDPYIVFRTNCKGQTLLHVAAGVNKVTFIELINETIKIINSVKFPQFGQNPKLLDRL